MQEVKEGNSLNTIQVDNKPSLEKMPTYRDAAATSEM